MKTELSFLIEDKPLEELVKDKNMYPSLRCAVRTRSEDKAIKKERIEKLDIAEMNTNVAVLYQLCKANTLNAEFEDYVLKKPGMLISETVALVSELNQRYVGYLPIWMSQR